MALAISSFLAAVRVRGAWWGPDETGESGSGGADLDGLRRDADARIDEVLQRGKEMLDREVDEAEGAIAELQARNDEIGRVGRDDPGYDDLQRERQRNNREIRKITDDLERFRHDHYLIVQRQAQVVEAFLPDEIKRSGSELSRLIRDYGI